MSLNFITLFIYLFIYLFTLHFRTWYVKTFISKFWFDGKLSEDVGFIKLKASSTNPAEETMTRLVKTIYALSNRWTVITVIRPHINFQ